MIPNVKLHHLQTQLRGTDLFKAMMSCGRYESENHAMAKILDLRERAAKGEDTWELLHEEGFEPDYAFDIIGM